MTLNQQTPFSPLVSNEIYLGVILIVVLNEFHATLFIIPHFI